MDKTRGEMSVEDERKLFVAGLADEVSEDVLRQLFEAVGAVVVNLTIPRNRDTGESKGFGFVTLDTPEGARAAKDALDGTFQAGRTMTVREFRTDRGSVPAAGAGPSSRQPPPAEDSTLYVGNLPYDTTREEITELFGSAGFSNVVKIHLPMDPTGRPRGFGFVSLASAEEASGAAEQMSDATVRGRTLSISVARSRGSRGPRQDGGGPRRGAGGPDGPRPSYRSNRPPEGGGTADWNGGGGGFPAGPPPGGPGGSGRDGGRRDRKREKKHKGSLHPERGGRKRHGEDSSGGGRGGRFQGSVDWDED